VKQFKKRTSKVIWLFFAGIIVVVLGLTLITETLSSRQVEDFEFLELGISYQEVVAHVGEPDEEVGSGVHVFLYQLDKDRYILLSFISLDSLHSAQLIDDNEQWLVGGQ
jgi:hypothetical protein